MLAAYYNLGELKKKIPEVQTAPQSQLEFLGESPDIDLFLKTPQGFQCEARFKIHW